MKQQCVVSLHFGSNGCFLPFLHPRSLHGNHEDYTTAAQGLALPKVKSGDSGQVSRDWATWG